MMNANSSLLQPGASIKPKIKREQIEEILQNEYAFRCIKIRELNGYDDLNYWVQVEQIGGENKLNPDGYVLKIINSQDTKDPAFFDAQNQLLIHLRSVGICCPQPVKTKSDKYFTIRKLISGEHIVRLLEFIEGEVLHKKSPISSHLFHEIGKCIAEIDLALTNFHHVAYDTRKTLWMLDATPQLKQRLYVIDDEQKKRVFLEVIGEFEQALIPAIGRLEKGIIHGDLNEQNILVEGDNVKAVLDFGDSHLNCYLFELAITMAYMMLQERSLEPGRWVFAGYTSVKQLAEFEYSLLKVCICARLTQSLVMGAYTKAMDPDNGYVLVTAENGWLLLKELWGRTQEELLKEWRNDLF